MLFRDGVPVSPQVVLKQQHAGSSEAVWAAAGARLAFACEPANCAALVPAGAVAALCSALKSEQLACDARIAWASCGFILKLAAGAETATTEDGATAAGVGRAASAAAAADSGETVTAAAGVASYEWTPASAKWRRLDTFAAAYQQRLKGSMDAAGERLEAMRAGAAVDVSTRAAAVPVTHVKHYIYGDSQCRKPLQYSRETLLRDGAGELLTAALRLHSGDVRVMRAAQAALTRLRLRLTPTGAATEPHHDRALAAALAPVLP